MATQNIINEIAPIFNGENYDFWVVKMTILKSRDLWEAVEKGIATNIASTSKTSKSESSEPSKEEIIKYQNAL